jgi:hypothetical protein
MNNICKTCNGTKIEYDGAGHTCTACNGLGIQKPPVAPTVTGRLVLPAIATRLAMAAGAWAPGTKMQTIIADGWSRGFFPDQTLHECIQAGYSACIAGPAIEKRWNMMDAEYEVSQQRDLPREMATSQDLRSAEDKAAAIQRYEDYWQRCLTKSHHEIDCPNTGGCDHRLKIARPAKGSGEMWDSLATCPYCNGTFFYESRPLRIDVAFKGFI